MTVLSQDLLGRRVGGPNAQATATMRTVMMVGNLAGSHRRGGEDGASLRPAEVRGACRGRMKMADGYCITDVQAIMR
ncbi:MAG: hypothetical protein ACREMQ_11970 [Longimicrobiales bacterium]